MFLTLSKGRSLAPSDQNKQRFQGQVRGGGVRGRNKEGTLPVSPREGEPGHPPLSAPAPCPGEVSGCPCPAHQGCTGGPCGCARRGVSSRRILRDGESPGDAGQGENYGPSAGTAKPTCCSGFPTVAAERRASPLPPCHPHRTGG